MKTILTVLASLALCCGHSPAADPWRLGNQPTDGLTPPPEGPLSGQGKAN